MQNDLAISVSLKWASVALRTGHEVFCKHLLQDSSTFFVDSMNVFLKEHHLSWKDISNLVVASGPGSFTGIRVGMSFAKAINQLTDVNVSSVSYFDLLEERFASISTSDTLFVLSSENPSEFYYKTVDEPAQVARIGESKIFQKEYDKIICDSECTFLEQYDVRSVIVFPDVKEAEHLLNFVHTDCHDLKPFYVKPPYVVKNNDYPCSN